MKFYKIFRAFLRIFGGEFLRYLWTGLRCANLMLFVKGRRGLGERFHLANDLMVHSIGKP